MVKIMLKISKASKLGQDLIVKGMEKRQEKAVSSVFSMTADEIKDNGVNVNIVNDRMGLMMAVQSLGDNIAKTIRLGQNITAIDFEQFINEDGVLGDKAVEVALMYSGLYWKVWDKELKEINMKAAKEIVAARRGRVMEPIYKNSDIAKECNKFGMKRNVFTVNDYYIQKVMDAFESVNEDTTLEELKAFQNAFVFPTRGLGEQTIDVTKHVDYVFIAKMENIVSPYVSVVGGLKKADSNIDTYRRNKEQYEITSPAEDKKERFSDVIGHFKYSAAEEMEEQLNGYIEALEQETNYDSYKEYESIDLSDRNVFALASVVDQLMDVEDMTEEEKERALAGLYNLADDLEIPQEDVIKIAIKLCISSVRRIKGQDYIISVLDGKNDYKADLYKVALLFGDIFVAEYAGSNVIEVPVEYETEIDIEEGTVLDLVDGYAACGMVRVFGTFQDGQVKVNDGELVALYNPVQAIRDRYPNATLLTVDSYAKEECTFGSWKAATIDDLDPENIASIGFTVINLNKAIRVVKAGEQYVVIALTKDGGMVASAKISDSYTNSKNDFMIKNAKCFKSVIIADQMAISNK